MKGEMKMKKENLITLTNIWQASYLLHEGEKFVDTILEGNRVAFTFQNNPAVQEKISDFLTDKATISPQKYISFYQYLKNLIYEKKRGLK